MFAYCLSNPICYIDTIGQFSVAFYRDDDNELFSSDDLGFGGDSGGSPWDDLMVYLDSALRGLEMAMGGRSSTTQKHHIFSNKHSKYTPLYQEVFDRHNAELTQKENIIELAGHSGRHTNRYHNVMLGALYEIERVAMGDHDLFIIGLEKIGEYLVEHPEIPYIK